MPPVLATSRRSHTPVGLLCAATTVVWSVAAIADVIGLKWAYEKVKLPPRPPAMVSVERLNVNVVRSPVPAAPGSSSPPPSDRLPEPAAPAPLPLPALAPVADAKLDIPFPVAVKQPSQIVAPSKAAPLPVKPIQPVSAVEPVRLTLGEGEGDQPAPEYPPEARLAHQEGSVVVQMTIDESGEVTEAKVTRACSWPILNQAALRAVQDSWHFKKGPVRYRDIEFDFELHAPS